MHSSDISQATRRLHSDNPDKALRYVYEVIHRYAHLPEEQGMLFSHAAQHKLEDIARQHRHYSDEKALWADLLALKDQSNPPDRLSRFLERRSRPANVRKLLSKDFSQLAKNKVWMALMSKVPEGHVASLLDQALFVMIQANDEKSCQTLLRLGADPNRPMPWISSAYSSLRVPAYLKEAAHPLSELMKPQNNYMSSSHYKSFLFYLALGASPDGIQSPIPANALRAPRTIGSPVLTPMSQCFESGYQKPIEILMESKARSPFLDDHLGVRPFSLKTNAKMNKAEFETFKATLEQQYLLDETQESVSKNTSTVPAKQKPRL